MSSEWQVVDTLQKKKEKLKQKHVESAIEAAAREKLRKEEEKEKEAELKRLGLGFTITDVSTTFRNKPKKVGKKGQGKSKQINAIYDLHIPSEEQLQKKKAKAEKQDKPKKQKVPKEPKERKEKSNLAEACAGLDFDVLQNELKKIEVDKYTSLPGVQLPKLAEIFDSAFPKVQPFNKHAEGHLYKRIQSPLRTFEENNEEVFTLVTDWIGDRPVSGDFVTLLVDQLVDPTSQGVGIRILLSILARYHPQRIVGESQYIVDKLPLRTVTWIFLQTMYADPDLALLLWVRHMLPQYLTNEKESTEAVIYLACLFTYIRKKGHRVHVPMPEGEFASLLGQFLVARATFPETNFTLIKDHYYELLDTSFITPKDPTKLFEELLDLSTSSDSNVSSAAIDVLIYNLKANTEIFRVWKEIYADHVVETNNLLVFIRKNYEKIQTSMLPPIAREAHTYVSDVSSDEREDEDKKETKKKGMGASMEINGKTLRHSSPTLSSSPSSSSSSSSSRKPHGRPTPISIRELQLLLTRIEEINQQLAEVKKPKGKKAKEEASNIKRVNKDTLNVCNATCQALRETMTQSKSGRESEKSVIATCVKGVIGIAGIVGVVGLALQYVYGYEALEQVLYAKY